MNWVRQKSEWVIFAGFAMIIIAAVAEGFLPKLPDKIVTLSDWRKFQELKHTWQYLVVGQISWSGNVVFAMSLVIIGLRLLRKKLRKLFAILYLVAGLGICAFYLVTLYFTMTFNYTIPKPNAELLRQNIESHNYDVKLKSKLSKMYARDKYTYEGKTVEYFTETGDKLLYQPTKEDQEFREQDVLVNEIWRENRKRSRPNFYCWIAITMISLLLGIFTPVEKKHPTLG
ncbi:hypothetical protein GHYDROH2_18650 [Geobacter hydrogenophilus]|uniref:Uncharacterized protein n=2 Tax=Geobacter hydrogenophilus TaxID=40983 RepID=A0A9W6G0U4_9BACT|nr:hypothetical protein [Geobacter hydrogenophilus]GLI38364.1 hypothetical protein GHYDROH2_18650 [Geobacter hydrogenophilus]